MYDFATLMSSKHFLVLKLSISVSKLLIEETCELSASPGNSGEYRGGADHKNTYLLAIASVDLPQVAWNTTGVQLVRTPSTVKPLAPAGGR